MGIPRKVFFITFLKACRAGMADSDSKIVKILKYHNETKILHGLAHFLTKISDDPELKNGLFGFSL
jgi:hypothetical protein